MKFKVGQLVRHKTNSAQAGQEMIITYVDDYKYYNTAENHYTCRWMADSKIYEEIFSEIELVA